MKSEWPKSALNSLLDLAFPPLCLHCEAYAAGKPLCPLCLDLLEFADPAGRCRQCFAPEGCGCKEFVLDGAAAAFDRIGPINTLVSMLRQGKWWLADGLGALMASRFLQLDWPMPDLIVPVPLSWMRSFSRGYNQSRLLAEALGRILDVPVGNHLKRLPGDFSQMKLDPERRLQLSQESFYLKGEEALYDKTVLLVDDIIGTGMTLRRSAEALLQGCPTKIYALSLCHG